MDDIYKNVANKGRVVRFYALGALLAASIVSFVIVDKAGFIENMKSKGLAATDLSTASSSTSTPSYNYNYYSKTVENTCYTFYINATSNSVYYIKIDTLNSDGTHTMRSISNTTTSGTTNTEIESILLKTANYPVSSTCNFIYSNLGTVASSTASSTYQNSSSTISQSGTGTNGGVISSSTSSSTSPDSSNNTVEAFSLTKVYPYNYNIYPQLYKDNIRVYDNISGIVSIRVELPSSHAVLMLGNSGGWMTGGIMREGTLFKQVSGTSRYVYDFDTRVYADGYYKVGAAYYDTSKGWVLTAVTDFSVKNNVVVNEQTVTPGPTLTIVTTTTPTSTKSVVAEVVKQVATNTASTTPPVVTSTTVAPTELIKTTTLVEREKPVLRLVVNDRQITDLRHVFDSEELELRVTNYPATAVQFFAYAVDGAFKPALKEIGWGGRDNLLSRDGKEVWTFTEDMNNFPTGNFRLFARVRYLDNTLAESQPISIVVQHLNQIKNSIDSNPPSDDTNATSVSRESILQRVRDPSECQNRQECEVFCSNNPGAQDKCINFVRSKNQSQEAQMIEQIKKNQEAVMSNFSSLIPEFITRIDGTSTISTSTNNLPPEYSGRPSVVDVVPSVVIEKIIESKDKISGKISEDVKTISDLQHYCGVVEHEEGCVEAITKVAPELKNEIEKQAEIVRTSEDGVKDLLEKRSGARVYIDSDGDGVTDFDEINIYNTDPLRRDTNNDGFSDGAALLGQMNATGKIASNVSSSSMLLLGENVSVENPKITGATQSNQFKITDVTAADVKQKENGEKEVSKIALKGVALPNSFVKIFLFSEPIVVTVKTDDSGNWSYVLDKTLPDGTHTAYVAMADGGGRILAKSDPLPFVKEASAITVTDKNRGLSDDKTTIFGLSPITLIALLVGVLGLSLSVVGVVIGLKGKKDNWPDIPNAV